jgi:integrase
LPKLLFANAETEQDRVVYIVAAYSGLRQGEILALRWRWVDFVDGLLHVQRNYTDGKDKIPKGKKVRSVPMTPAVMDALAKLKERGYLTDNDDLVFVGEGGGYVNHFNLRRAFYRTIKNAGLREIRFHDLRHYFGTQAVTVLDPLKVQGYMGHKHYSTTQRYLHHKPKREDAARLHTAFGGTAEPYPEPYPQPETSEAN